MRIGTNELLIILVVALLIFGPKNLPKLGKMFGKTMNNFKKGMEEGEEEENTSKAETKTCLLYTSPSPRDGATSRMPSSA